MAKIVQTRRGTTEQHKGFDGQQGEVTVDLSLNTLRVHDGSTFPVDQPSGYPLARSDMSNVSNCVGVEQLSLSECMSGQMLTTDGNGTIFWDSPWDIEVGGDLSGIVSNAQIVPNAVGTLEIADFSVTREKLAIDLIDNTKIADDAIQTENIINSGVMTDNIANLNVTRAKLENDIIDNTKVADNAIQTENIVDLSINTSKLAADAVTNAKLADDAVQTENIVNQSVTVEKLAASGILPALDGSQLTNIITVPEGLIAMWSGTIANIPSGWAICDGTNNTPDLRDRFVIGAGSTHNISDTGGSTDTGPHTLTIAEMPTHSHSGAQAGGTRNAHGDNGSSGASNAGTGDAGGNGSHTHTGTLPPYFALAYIMKLPE